MDTDAAINALCRDLFELIVDTLSHTRDEYALSD